MKEQARDKARHQTRRVRQGFSHMLDENPVALGAVAFGLGLASGISAPTTSTEDQLGGRASDTLKREAKDAGEDTAEGVRRVAREAAFAAGDEMDRQREGRHPDEMGRETGRSVGAEAGAVAGRTKDAAVRRAGEEGPTPEDLEQRARKMGEESRRQAERDVDPGGGTRKG